MKNVTGKTFMVLVLILATFQFSSASPLFSAQVQLDVTLGKPYLFSGQKELNYVKIGLIGFPIESAKERSPVNLAIVIDRSGSMQGDKLSHAKQAAAMVVERLNSDDIISVIAYDSDVKTLIPATKVSDKPSIIQAIRSLEAGSNTALFAGVSKGAKEVRKFLDKRYVNRLILLSDGLANEGPSSPEELGDLGAALSREGISVTTFGLGLGYNEDLMMQLARRSDGNHAFIEKPEELARIFNLELGDVLSVVAQEVKVEITCRNVRPIRVLGRDVDIRGQSVFAALNQLYSKQEKFILLEVEPLGDDVQKPEIEVGVSYLNMKTQTPDKLTNRVEMKYCKDENMVKSSENKDVMISVINLLANEHYKVATKLRDEGKIEDARKALAANESYLFENAEKYKSETLKKFATQNKDDASNLDESSWNKTRKNMRKYQQTEDYQQSY